jgi:putative ABC transport system permease protein
MIVFATLKIAVRALRRNTLRTLLTMLGIIIGVGAVIAMVSIGNGAKSQIESQIASLGQNLIQVMSGNFNRGGVRGGWGSAPTLTREDYDAMRKEVLGISGISPEVGTAVQVMAGNQNNYVSVKGVGADYLDVRSWGLVRGNNFTEQDIRQANKVAIIGQTTATNLFGDADPVGQVIRMKNAPFTIMGLLERKGSMPWGGDQDDVILVPYTSAMKRLSGQATGYRTIFVQAQTAPEIPEVQNQIAELLRQRHRIGGDKDDDFMVMTQQEISDRVTATSRIMTVLLGSIASVSLLVGGIGIMNIMLVSVTERTREIGIRLAVGARSHDILMQFLIEAVTLSAVGGILGILLGIGSSRFISAKMSWPTLTSPDSIIVAFVFSAAVGIFFGFYPARKASHLDPIEALRYE